MPRVLTVLLPAPGGGEGRHRRGEGRRRSGREEAARGAARAQLPPTAVSDGAVTVTAPSE